MPGYVRGFVERTFADDWRFVCRVDPFTGSQGRFKYVLFGTGFARLLDPVVHSEGFPEDLAPLTKLAMLGRTHRSLDRLSNADLDEQFETFQERTADAPHPRHVTLERLEEYDWDRGITDENRARMAEMDLESGGPLPAQAKSLRLFELVDAEGRDYPDWEGVDDGDGWRRRVHDQGKEDPLLRGEPVTFEGRSVSLRARSRRELLPERWFELLDLLSGHHGTVRFTFYWHH